MLWSSAEFGFVSIGDACTTGSSLMPQKKNPDCAELARGKSARLLGNLVQSLALLKGLPLTYNRDLQEDKQPLFDSADILSAVLPVTALMVSQVTVNHERCQAAAADPMLLATDLADFLVQRGTPFREAHHAVGKLVAESERTGRALPELAAAKFGKDAGRVFDLERALRARTTVGAPSPANVARQLTRWKKALA